MIVVKLMGGLGNQMFQYATGRRLALAHDAPLKLDLSWFDTQEKRHYELGDLCVFESFATPGEVLALTRNKPSPLHRLLGREARARDTWIRERHFHFDATVLDLPDGLYLEGYWQSERYFADIAHVLREEFAVRNPLEGRNAEMAERMANSSSMSVHVRRGDYVDEPETKAEHGVCGPDYYQQAVERVREHAEEPHAFVFSDDPAWVRAHFELPCPMTVVDHNGPAAHEDLRLMTRCRHHIIANSSFGWWGAWLHDGPASGVLVVAPHRWFNRDDVDTSTVIPDDWVRL